MPRWLTLTSLATLLAFLVMVLPAGHAHAQQPPQPPPPPPAAPAAPPSGGQVDPELAQAQAHFQAGKDAFAAGDSTTAIREWKAAQALRPSPKLDYNIGLAYEKLNRPRAATKYYRRYIEQLPTAPNRAEVEQKIAQLASRAAKAPADEGTEGATQPPTGAQQPGAQQQPGSAAQPQYQQVPPGYQPPPGGYQAQPGYPQQPGQPGYQAQPGYPQQPGQPAYGQPGQPPTYYANAPAPVQPVQPPPAKKSSNWWIVFPIVGGVLLTLMLIYLMSGASSSSRGGGDWDWDAVPGGRGGVPSQEPALFRF